MRNQCGCWSLSSLTLWWVFSVRQGWEHVCELSVVKQVDQQVWLSSMTLTLCISDLKLHWLLLQLSHLAWQLENIIYFCLVYLKKTADKIWLGVEASVWEADVHCQSTVDCKAHMWSTKDTESMLPMMCTCHLDMQCKFVSSELTNTDNRNRSVPEKRMNVFISLSIGVSAD